MATTSQLARVVGGLLVLLAVPRLRAAFDVYDPQTLIAKATSFRYPIADAIDWDSDGDWDLVVGEWGEDGGGYFAGIQLYLNHGDNASPNLTFQSYVTAGGSPIRVGYG